MDEPTGNSSIFRAVLKCPAAANVSIPMGVNIALIRLMSRRALGVVMAEFQRDERYHKDDFVSIGVLTYLLQWYKKPSWSIILSFLKHGASA